MSYLAPRFWLPHGQPVSLDYAGFLPDPENPFGQAANPFVRSLDTLRDLGGLVLLGEPGLGKSTALSAERDRLRTTERGELVLHVDLGATGQEEVLQSRIFGCDTFVRWTDGSETLHLLLDSLDEARLRIEVIADLLLEGLRSVDMARIKLMITCRSADRHLRLEEQLAAMFPSESFAVLELLPLRAADVSAFAEVAGVDSGSFIREVIARNLVPLASRPLTLRLLLQAASGGEGLPAGVTALYLRGCKLLAEEPDEDRRTGSTMGTLTAGERIALAGRIAGAMVFSGRSTVLTDIQAPPTKDDVTIEELVGGREITDSTTSDTFAATEQAVTETLRTGLFSARSDGRLGFAHQTFAEFLAARYLSTHMSSEQALSLLTLREADGARVVPQLREVATWMATVSPELFETLLPADLDVLLHGDLAFADDGQRAALVGALLLAAEDQTVNRYDTRLRGNLEALAHPNIVAQVSTVLFDPAAVLSARELASDLVGACQLVALTAQMVALALDDEVPLTLRQSIVVSLSGGWVDPTALDALKPLAIDPPACDVTDELRGSALRALWPGKLGAKELFDSLRPTKVPMLVGIYRVFLRNELMKGLSDEDLPVALRWAQAVPREHGATDAFSELAQKILARAWGRREEPRVFSGLVSLISTFLAGGYNMLDHEEARRGVALNDREGRRAVVAALASSIADGSLDAVAIVLSTPRLLEPDDVPWLIEQLAEHENGPLEIGWARLVHEMLGFDVSIELVLQARESSSALRAMTAYRFDAVRLDSQQADAERANFQRFQAWDQQRSEETEEAPDMKPRILEDLVRVENGEPDGYWHLNLDLSVEPGHARYTRHFQSDLTRFPGWESADLQLRERIVRASERYLTEGDPETQDWFGQGKLMDRPAAGYRALRLLAEQAPDRLAALGAEVWERWAPIIMSWPSDAAEDADMNRRLVAFCFKLAPTAARRWLLAALDAETLRGPHAFAIRRLGAEVLDGLSDALLQRAANDELPREARLEILQALLDQRSPDVRDLANRLVHRVRVDENPGHRTLAIDVARLLIEHAPDAGWPTVWPLVQRDQEFGRAVFEAVAHGSERSVAERLGERALAELFSWLEMQYPRAEDKPANVGASFMSVRDHIARWRDQTLLDLARRGSEEAIVELERLQTEFPELLWLARLVREAQELVRRARWTPPRPRDVIHLAADATRRWVTDDAELREVLVASLLRAGEQLQAATPAAPDLWDTSVRRPKPENQLSDWLKRHLERDLRGRGITIGREVQIRPGPGGKMGEAGDLVVEALAAERVEGAPVVSATLEVKGCWHPELDRAMATQLAARYLLPEGQRQGIYVVGWFAADDWDIDDRRHKRCARRGLEESRAFFAEQAGEVSGQHDVQITAVVLDCSLPPREGPARRT
jgi:hypothetical protein